MADNKKTIGVIIVGNSGVGKSYLANHVLNQELFKHEYDAESVTFATEYKEVELDMLNVRVYNIPGLIEADQDKIDRNIREISKAYDQCPNSIILFVSTTTGGRVRSEDIVAYKALNEAYPFDPTSTGIIINDLKRVDAEYISKLKFNLNKLGMIIDHMLPIAQGSSQGINKKLHEDLMKFILEMQPTVHIKVKDINLVSDEIRGMIENMNKLQMRLDQLLEENKESQDERRALQKKLEDEIKRRENRTLREAASEFGVKLLQTGEEIMEKFTGPIIDRCLQQ